MKKSIVMYLLSAVLIFSAFGNSLWAGQVVTDEVKAWARSAVEQEKSLGANPSGNTVAVLYFRNTTGSQKLTPLQKGLAFMLMTDLAKVGDIQLVERVKLQALVEELGLGASGVVDDSTAPRVGRLLQARYLVGGDLLQGQASELNVDSDVVGTQKMNVLGNPKAEGMFAQLFDIEKKLLFQIIDILKVKVSPEKKRELQKPLSTDPQALFYMFSGLDSSDRGDYLSAEAGYKKALERDPGLTPAKDALDELFRLKLVTPKKRSRALTQDLEDKTSSTDSLIPDDPERRYGDPGDNEKRTGATGQIRVQW